MQTCEIKIHCITTIDKHSPSLSPVYQKSLKTICYAFLHTEELWFLDTQETISKCLDFREDLPFQSRDAPKDSRVKNIEGTSLLLKLSGNPFSQGQPDKKTLKKWGGNLR